MNNIRTKRVLITLGAFVFALGFQYFSCPHNFLDLDHSSFWIPFIFAFISYWVIVTIIMWIFGYKLKISIENIKLLFSKQLINKPLEKLNELSKLNKIVTKKYTLIIFGAFVFALGFQYLCEPSDFLDLDNENFLGYLIFGFAWYWAFVKIAAWVINGYKLNTNTGNIKLIISLASIAVALGVQYLIDPHDFLDFDDDDFWWAVTLVFAGYWAIVRIIIWVIDGYKLNTNNGNIKLTISLASIVVAWSIRLVDLELDGEQFLATLSFIEYWILIAIISNRHKSNTGSEVIKLVSLILAFIFVLFVMLILLTLQGSSIRLYS